MPPTIESLGIDKLSVEDRLQLVGAIWDSIAEDSSTRLITESQKAELDRRLEDKKIHPDDFIPWDKVRAEALGRIRQGPMSSSLITIFRPAARKEFHDAVDWYAERSSAVAERFIDAMTRTLNHIEQRPELYAKAHKDIREALVQGFPYCIYYEVEATSIDVIAVFHTSRNPEIWQRRS